MHKSLFTSLIYVNSLCDLTSIQYTTAPVNAIYQFVTADVRVCIYTITAGIERVINTWKDWYLVCKSGNQICAF